jgi:hypothetical protein
VRLPKRLQRGLELFAEAYPGMSRSVAIRCLIELGLARVAYYVVDPKTKIGWEGDTPALRKFLARARPKVAKWIESGLPQDRGPPASYKPGRRPPPLSQEAINAAVARAIARSNALRRKA